MSEPDAFDQLRPLLFTIAYEILGSAADAEDVLQESYLRWRDVDPGQVEHPKGYLVQVVTRQALNQLRSVRRRREDYIGNWLPEPIRTEQDASHDVLLAESVSMAMMLVLETLGPTERAVFVLSEVFGHSLVEIAGMIGKSETAVRQIAHRAREHVQARRKRFQPDTDTSRAVVDRFLLAARTGDVGTLLEVLAPDVVQISDGGGRVTAARRPIIGAEQVARYLLGLARIMMADMTVEFGSCNALPALLIRSAADGRLDTVLMIEMTGERITGLYAVRNPDKLRTVDVVRSLDLSSE
ncbi:RNA polymerase sigma-70 factor [Nocardia terpenica]|uniref:RNA polymerase sigma-70 factor n=1 Tax=Nocardia terpenica TaxID=455432 RepID=UPI0018960111|nr:RNA polymerase sigma-70 factor [Nocardia terpenica]MBF6059189.1 RNA polymerase sigma-70 factor [Nocardia terpenica]MBF6103272.1 RNA polymerase sigma-70 factor [Nocardia terpenica]MBF6110539.1 RNA polymerase sigma-70 factor [Nocardia terpenica]MBF6116670.1 RNA polymerase sigma-70 factor [Nocardia terpenica]